MRSFLFASMLAAGGFFGFKNIVEPELNIDGDNVVAQDSPATVKLREARQARSAGDFKAAEDAYLEVIESGAAGAPAVNEFVELLNEQGREREALTVAYEHAEDDVARQKTLRRLDTLNAKLMNPNDTYGGERYVIRSGDTLAKIAKAKNSNKRLLQRINKIDNPNRIHAGQAIKVVSLKIRCLVDISERELRAYTRQGLLKVYRVGVGATDQPTPTGTFTVEVMQKQPPFWSQPGKPPIPAGDPRNPLGSRWMGFGGDFSSYGIHGTNQDESIGQASSQGCVRMAKKDVEELFDLADHGMIVEIVE